MKWNIPSKGEHVRSKNGSEQRELFYLEFGRQN